MLGTWRTSDAEKNHTLPIKLEKGKRKKKKRKRKKKKKKEKRQKKHHDG